MVSRHGPFPTSTSFIDVLDRILDKGVVIDAWVRISLVGISLTDFPHKISIVEPSRSDVIPDATENGEDEDGLAPLGVRTKPRQPLLDDSAAVPLPGSSESTDDPSVPSPRTSPSKKRSPPDGRSRPHRQDGSAA